MAFTILLLLLSQEKNMIDDRIAQQRENDEQLEQEFNEELNKLLRKIETLYGQIDDDSSSKEESESSLTRYEENNIRKHARELDEQIDDLQSKIQQIDEDMQRVNKAFNDLKVGVLVSFIFKKN